jgi:hypothetical protein
LCKKSAAARGFREGDDGKVMPGREGKQYIGVRLTASSTLMNFDDQNR